MSRFRAYLKPFNEDGTLGEFVEVTQDMQFESMSNITRQIDNDEFGVGEFKFNRFGFRLRNENGLYSDVGESATIFKRSRGGSEFKLTWEIADDETQCGVAIAGKAKISPQVDVYLGVLNDDAARNDIENQTVSFQVLSYDSVFDTVETPFASLSVGDLYSEILLTLLNQSEITTYLTVDSLNINVGLDLTVDDISDFENTTVKEAIDKVLFQSNSVLYIEGTTVIIRSRDADLTNSYTFIGQASNEGIENIVRISNLSSGLKRVFNYWTWEDTNLLSQDATSVSQNGVRKKQISFNEITDTGKRQSILDAQKDEFSFKKQTLKLTTFVNYDTLALTFLNRVNIDYPTVNLPANFGDELPIYNLAVYDVDVYPLSQFGLTISKEVPFKIMGIDIDTKNQNIIFNLKEI